MSWFRKAADQGDAGAQYHLGLLYRNGNGVPQDYAAAVSWFRMAADQGDAAAQYSLGSIYFDGRGAPQDYGGRCKLVSKGR
jgi:TPR repeat protein